MRAKKVSIVIVNYNSGQLLERCVSSIQASIDVAYEIIVVDNASSDTSLEFLQNASSEQSGVVVVRNPRNVGFAEANNIGAANATGDIFHFLNPDTMVESNLNQCYRQILDAAPTRCVYPTALRNENGVLIKNYHLLPTVRNYVSALFAPSKCQHWWIGASIIIERKVFIELGGWPTDYFMYAEDLDLFFRIARANIDTMQTECFVFHTGKGSTSNVWSELERAIRVEQSTRRFYAKYDLMVDYYVVSIVHLMQVLILSPAAALERLKIMFAARNSR